MSIIPSHITAVQQSMMIIAVFEVSHGYSIGVIRAKFCWEMNH